MEIEEFFGVALGKNKVVLYPKKKGEKQHITLKFGDDHLDIHKTVNEEGRRKGHETIVRIGIKA